MTAALSGSFGLAREQVSNMTLLSDLINAIEAADLPAAVYRTAVRLARLADETKRVVLGWEEFQPLTGCTHVDAARRHLRALGNANGG